MKKILSHLMHRRKFIKATTMATVGVALTGCSSRDNKNEENAVPYSGTARDVSQLKSELAKIKEHLSKNPKNTASLKATGTWAIVKEDIATLKYLLNPASFEQTLSGISVSYNDLIIMPSYPNMELSSADADIVSKFKIERNGTFGFYVKSADAGKFVGQQDKLDWADAAVVNLTNSGELNAKITEAKNAIAQNQPVNFTISGNVTLAAAQANEFLAFKDAKNFSIINNGTFKISVDQHPTRADFLRAFANMKGNKIDVVIKADATKPGGLVAFITDADILALIRTYITQNKNSYIANIRGENGKLIDPVVTLVKDQFDSKYWNATPEVAICGTPTKDYLANLSNGPIDNGVYVDDKGVGQNGGYNILYASDVLARRPTSANKVYPITFANPNNAQVTIVPSKDPKFEQDFTPIGQPRTRYMCVTVTAQGNQNILRVFGLPGQPNDTSEYGITIDNHMPVIFVNGLNISGLNFYRINLKSLGSVAATQSGQYWDPIVQTFDNDPVGASLGNLNVTAMVNRAIQGPGKFISKEKQYA